MESFIITNSGKELQAKLLEGTTTVAFTRVSTSDYDYSGVRLEALTEMDNVKQTALISGVTRTSEMLVEVLASIENSGLSDGYYIRALGLYAKDGEENEILYAVSVAGEQPDYMPAFAGGLVSAVTYTMNIQVANAKQVSMEVNLAATPTMEQVEEIKVSIDRHKSENLCESSGAHGLRYYNGELQLHDEKQNKWGVLFEKDSDLAEHIVSFSIRATRSNILSGETIGTMFGKIRKWFSDTKDAAFYNVSNSLTQTSVGYVADARAVSSLANRVGELNDLTTTTRESIVESVNENHAAIQGLKNTVEITKEVTYDLSSPELWVMGAAGDGGNFNYHTDFLPAREYMEINADSNIPMFVYEYDNNKSQVRFSYITDLIKENTKFSLGSSTRFVKLKTDADMSNNLRYIVRTKEATIDYSMENVFASLETLNSNLATPVRDTLWSGTAGANKTITLSKSLYDYNEVYFSNDVDGIRAKCLVTNNLAIIRAGGSTVTSAGNTATFGVTGDVSNEGKTIKITNVAYMTHIASGNNSALTARNIVSVIGIR